MAQSGVWGVFFTQHRDLQCKVMTCKVVISCELGSVAPRRALPRH